MNKDTQLLMERTTDQLIGIDDEQKFLFELDQVKHHFDAEGERVRPVQLLQHVVENNWLNAVRTVDEWCAEDECFPLMSRFLTGIQASNSLEMAQYFIKRAPLVVMRDLPSFRVRLPHNAIFSLCLKTAIRHDHHVDFTELGIAAVSSNQLGNIAVLMRHLNTDDRVFVLGAACHKNNQQAMDMLFTPKIAQRALTIKQSNPNPHTISETERNGMAYLAAKIDRLALEQELSIQLDLPKAPKKKI